MAHAWSPDLSNIAHTLENLEVRAPKPLAIKSLYWLIEHAEEARAMWSELSASRESGVTLYELAKLVAATETGGASPESQPVVVWILEQIPEIKEQWSTLRSLCEDMAVDPNEPRRPLSALQRSRDLDRLLSLDIWTDPAELLDPCRDCGYQYEELLALTDARLAREPDGPARDRLVVVRTRIARYADLDRHLKTLDEKLAQLKRWQEEHGQGMTSAELERAAMVLRLVEEREVG